MIIIAIFIWIFWKIPARIRSAGKPLSVFGSGFATDDCGSFSGYRRTGAGDYPLVVFQQTFQNQEPGGCGAPATDFISLPGYYFFHTDECTFDSAGHRPVVREKGTTDTGNTGRRKSDIGTFFPPPEPGRESIGTRIGTLYRGAAENEQMVAALSDERIQLEKQRYIYEQHIAGNKRQNLIKKACMAIVNGINPYIDRILNEVHKLTEKGYIDDDKIKRKRSTSTLMNW